MFEEALTCHWSVFFPSYVLFYSFFDFRRSRNTNEPIKLISTFSKLSNQQSNMFSYTPDFDNLASNRFFSCIHFFRWFFLVRWAGVKSRSKWFFLVKMSWCQSRSKQVSLTIEIEASLGKLILKNFLSEVFRQES